MAILIDLEGMAAEALGMTAGKTEPLDDTIWYVYHTQRDLRVRPSHAAFEGTVWRGDDPSAPTPPCDYGCRCYLCPIVAPHTEMAKQQLWPTTTKAPITVPEAFSRHLDEILPAWGDILAMLKKKPVVSRAEAAYASVSAADPALTAADARDIARMICVVANG